MSAVYARLRITDPARWRAVALAWRRWAALAGALRAEFGPAGARLREVWSGGAADAAVTRLDGFRRRLALFRLFCWRADQALSEFAAAVGRARALLDQARSMADQAGLVIDDRGEVHRPAGSTADARAVAADLAAAIAIAEQADETAAARLHGLSDQATPPDDPVRPDCTATPAEITRWWAALTPAERNWVLATEPGSVASTDGIPAADRDLANRLLLEQHRADLDRDRSHELAELSARLDDGTGPRAYLLGLDTAADGRAVVALGDPDRAGHVLTHVPGMTSDLASLGGELTRAERVAVRTAELDPAESASAVLWLDYDAPDFVDEAAGAGRARAASDELHRFLGGLRASHDGPRSEQTVLGHSYGSLVVGEAAAGPLDADRVVFVGSPGVGADSAAELTVPADRVWSSTSLTDPIQYLAVRPWAGELWFGENPSEPGFGARVFRSQPDAGHLGYWDEGRPALDALAALTLGEEPATRR
jgi:hypothetical protein